MSATKYGFTRFDTIKEFETWLNKLSVTRSITRLQVHHTGAPSYANFYKSDGSTEDELTRQNNMKTYHKSIGFSDIAQQLTIFPNGKIVTGRSFNTAPAGITGWNTGAVCVEIYGNFDKGEDTMNATQKQAVLAVYYLMAKKFGITISSTNIKPHAWFTSSGTNLGTYIAGKSRKTCPGTNFMGYGNTKTAFEKFITDVKNYNSSTTTSSSTSSSTYKTGIYRVTATSLNVRKGAGTSYAVVTSVKKGEAYTITAVSGSWGKLASGLGWIHLGYCKFVR